MIVAAFLTSAISFDNSIACGDKAPKIETLEGSDIISGSSDGKAKFISFWNPKKPASRIANKKYYNELLDNDNMEFISICTDNDEALMQEVMKMDGMNHATNYAYSQIMPRVFKDYEVEENPRAFIISSDGKIKEIR